MKTKFWDKQEIIELLETNNLMVYKSLMVLFNQQTKNEQENGNTIVNNGVGFNAIDADFMSSLAKQYNFYGRLTPKQVDSARKCLKKYAGQLTNLANQGVKV